MTEVQLRVLIPVQEYKLLKKLAQDHEKCGKSAIVSEGSGSVKECAGDSSNFQSPSNETILPSTSFYSGEKNIDQEVNLIPKDIIVNSSANVNVPKSIAEDEPLPKDAILSQLKAKFRPKGRKLLNILKKSNDFSFDKNGIVTIFGKELAGNLIK